MSIKQHKCDYGCDQQAKYKFKNGKYCCSRNCAICPNIRKKNSIKNRGRIVSEKSRKRLEEYNKNRIFSQEVKNKISNGQKLKKINPDKNNKIFCKCGKPAKFQSKSGKFWCEEYVTKCPLNREKQKIKMKNRKHNEETKEKMRGENNPMYGKHHTVEVIQKMKKQRNDPNSIYQSEEYRHKLSLAGKRKFLNKNFKDNFLKRYKDPKFLKKWSESFNLKPNKPEIIITKILEKIFPNEWKYVGDFKLWIGGKNPDFVNRKKKKLIEHFGIYWHGEKHTKVSNHIHEQQRMNHFKKYGYDTLVIWENELHNIKQLIDKIIEFNNRNFIQFSGNVK